MERPSQPPPVGKTLAFLKRGVKIYMDNLNADSEVLYTIAEVASLLKVNKNMVYQLINKGYLRSIKFGCRKVTRKALLDFLEKYDGEDIFASHKKIFGGKIVGKVLEKHNIYDMLLAVRTIYRGFL